MSYSIPVPDAERTSGPRGGSADTGSERPPHRPGSGVRRSTGSPPSRGRHSVAARAARLRPAPRGPRRSAERPVDPVASGRSPGGAQAGRHGPGRAPGGIRAPLADDAARARRPARLSIFDRARCRTAGGDGDRGAGHRDASRGPPAGPRGEAAGVAAGVAAGPTALRRAVRTLVPGFAGFPNRRIGSRASPRARGRGPAGSPTGPWRGADQGCRASWLLRGRCSRDRAGVPGPADHVRRAVPGACEGAEVAPLGV